MFQKHLIITTEKRGLTEITGRVNQIVAESGMGAGLCHVFLQHTSAALVLNENADPTVQSDLEDFFARLVPDGDPRYAHCYEGVDDMPAHIKAAILPVSLTMPVSGGALALGTWQGLYLWEHRLQRHRRRLVVTVWG